MTALAIGLTAGRTSTTRLDAARSWVAALRDSALLARYGAPPPAPEQGQGKDEQDALMIALLCAAHF